MCYTNNVDLTILLRCQEATFVKISTSENVKTALPLSLYLLLSVMTQDPL